MGTGWVLDEEWMSPSSPHPVPPAYLFAAKRTGQHCGSARRGSTLRGSVQCEQQRLARWVPPNPGAARGAPDREQGATMPPPMFKRAVSRGDVMKADSTILDRSPSSAARSVPGAAAAAAPAAAAAAPEPAPSTAVVRAPPPLRRDMSKSHFGASRANLFDEASVLQKDSQATSVHRNAASAIAKDATVSTETAAHARPATRCRAPTSVPN